ncbi:MULTISPECIES: phospholipase D-like domain-containing protein [Acidiphilium]|uniref:Phospholipase D n=1 Tax=Acidiphilium rubrum TaxID=526 RepID=A0A8G2CMR4_ACIRU|nr:MULTISPECIES: phospholipase D-like domain-containing protein [Acidiphilium]SIR29452.1 Phosphatidylserine/phosphatidylglycerophosphate/cardiolipin synthase [Acidiphilium rubrum]
MISICPQSGPAPVIRFIEDARVTLGINVYYLASKPVLRAIKADVRRGVKTYVIVDGEPYGISRSLVSRELAHLRATGAHVHVAPKRFEGRYRFDHAKYAVSHGEVLIGSANWDASAFHHDRDYIDRTASPALVAALERIFRADWFNLPAGDQGRTSAPTLVVSPGAEPTLARVIDQSGHVDIEAEELGDDPPIIRAIEAKGPDARIIFPMTLSRSDRDRVAALQRHGVHVGFLPKHPVYLHAKMIVGSQAAFIGSQNFSRASLNANREIGIILYSGRDRAALRRQFEIDWHNAVHLHQPT